MTINSTRAPWQLTFGEHDAAIHAGATIAMVDDTMGGWKSNAFLIAAAPDMLAALVLLVDGDGNPDECPRAMAAARAAIAKAKGDA